MCGPGMNRILTSCLFTATLLVPWVLATGCSRSELFDDVPSDLPDGESSESDSGERPDVTESPDATVGPDVTEGPDVVTGPDVAEACVGGCALTFASGSDWESYAGGAGPDAGDSLGASLGPAKDVCASLQVPANCPTTASAVVIYGFAQSGWTAGASYPQALWIWRGDVTPGAAADLQTVVFERSFVVGAQPAGSIQIGADDFAAVFVNDVPVGTVGSISDVSVAWQSQTVGATFDLTLALRPGSNKIAVVGQNGPASFAGGCGGVGCTYAQNPAGVVFAGALTWQ